jgi:nucleotide-binding universal stress UspA family protein
MPFAAISRRFDGGISFACSLLAVAAENTMLPIKTILHPTDFSDASKIALEFACGLAADYGAHLVIIHVVAAPLVLSDGAIVSMTEPGADGVRIQLNELEIPDGRFDVVRRVEEGNPAAEILNVADIAHADLIVMGSHGRSGLRRWFMGSVAEVVMRKATCPVLIATARSGGSPHSVTSTHADSTSP